MSEIPGQSDALPDLQPPVCAVKGSSQMQTTRQQTGRQVRRPALNRRSGMSVRLAAALNHPIDAVANCKDRKSRASDRSRRPMIRSLADVGVGLVWREE